MPRVSISRALADQRPPERHSNEIQAGPMVWNGPAVRRLRPVPNGNTAEGGPDPLLDWRPERLRRLLALLDEAQRRAQVETDTREREAIEAR